MLSDSFPAIPPPESSDEARLDELHRVLAHHRRRTTLRELRAAGTSLTVDELAKRVAGREATRPSGEGPAEDPETVELTLCHTHLPVLAASNLVEFDPSNRTVEFRTLTGER